MAYKIIYNDKFKRRGEAWDRKIYVNKKTALKKLQEGRALDAKMPKKFRGTLKLVRVATRPHTQRMNGWNFGQFRF